MLYLESYYWWSDQALVMMADIIISGFAKIALAGTRVVEQILKKSSNNFQSSESLLDAGMIDIICEKENLKETLAKVFVILSLKIKIRFDKFKMDFFLNYYL